MNYKIIISICVLLLNIIVNAQGVGINIDNPTNTLDVDGNFRLRDIPRYGTSRYLSTDENGVIGYSTKYGLSEIDAKVAAESVDLSVTRDAVKSLGLSTVVTIPAKTEAKVVIEYSVPVGLVGVTNSFESYDNTSVGYAGVAFYKDGVEARGGSRKYTTATWADDEYGTVVTVINKYVEKFAADDEPRTITYALYGYVESTIKRRDKTTKNKVRSARYRFNMYSDTPGENRNWGKAIITKKVYLK